MDNQSISIVRFLVFFNTIYNINSIHQRQLTKIYFNKKPCHVWIKKKVILNLFFYSILTATKQDFMNPILRHNTNNIRKIKNKTTISVWKKRIFKRKFLFLFFNNKNSNFYAFKTLLKLFFYLFIDFGKFIEEERSLIYLYVLVNQKIFKRHRLTRTFIKIRSREQQIDFISKFSKLDSYGQRLDGKLLSEINLDDLSPTQQKIVDVISAIDSKPS